MKFRMTPAQFNEQFRIIPMGDAGSEQFKKKEHDGIAKVSDNGKSVYGVPGAVLKNLDTNKNLATVYVSVEIPDSVEEFTKYGAIGEGVVTVTTFVNDGRENLSIIVPALGEVD